MQKRGLMARSNDNKETQQLLADVLGEQIINNLFQCGQVEGIDDLKGLPHLADFGWMVVHRCQLSFTNIVLGLLYLIRLKQRHPSCKGAYGAGHRLLLAALIVANKYLYDDAYLNHTWAEVTQGAFQLDEVNRMEFELIYFLKFSLRVSQAQWWELVELLDAKLHSELIAVGCLDSHRYRLTQQCGLDNPEMSAFCEISHPAVFIKQRMNQLTIDAPTLSPFQDTRKHKQRLSHDSSTLFALDECRKSSINLDPLYASLQRGNMVNKLYKHRRASLATPGIYPTSHTWLHTQTPERYRSNSIPTIIHLRLHQKNFSCANLPQSSTNIPISAKNSIHAILDPVHTN